MKRLLVALSLCLCALSAHAQLQCPLVSGTDVFVNVGTASSVSYTANGENYLALDNVGSNTILYSFGSAIVSALPQTGTLSVTNAPGALTNATFTLNGITLSWVTKVVTAASQMQITNSTAQAATNLYGAATNNTFGGGITITVSATNVIFTGIAGAQLNFSNNYIGWASLAVTTNAASVTNAAWGISPGSSKVFDKYYFPNTNAGGRFQISTQTTNGTPGALLIEKGY